MQVISRPLAGMRVIEVGGTVASLAAANSLRRLGAEVISLVGQANREGAQGVRTWVAKGLRSQDGAEIVVASPLSDGRWPEVDRALPGIDALIFGDEPIAREIDDYVSRKGACTATRVHLSRFGRGTGDSLRGLDIQAQALSGMMSIVGDPGRAPLYVPFELGDMLAGLHGATAAVAFANAAGDGGTGAEVEIASTDVLAASTRVYALLYRFYSMPVERAGRRAPGSGGRYPMTILPCKDGSVVLIARSETEWSRFIEMMGDPPWAREPKFRDAYAMAIEYPQEVDEKVIPWLRRHTKAQLTGLAQEYRVAMAPVRDVSEVLRDEQLAYRKFFERVQIQPNLSVLVPGMPMQFYR